MALKSAQYLSAIRGTVAKQAPRGERVIGSLFPNRGTYGMGTWSGDRVEQVAHYRHWVYVCGDLICSKIASVSPNIAYVSDEAIPGVTVKAGERGLMNLASERGWIEKKKSFGGSATIGGGSDWDYSNKWNADSLMTGSCHSFLTMGEYRSKSLSVVKPHENLEPLENFHPLRRLIVKPNRWDTLFTLLYESQMFQELCGVSYIWAVPNDFGVPCELWVIPSHWVFPRTGGGRLTQVENDSWRPMNPQTYVPPDSPHSDELIHYYEVRPWGGMGSAGILRIPPDQIIMEKWPSPVNKIDGYSRLSAIAQWIDLEESISKSRWSQMINSARPELWVELGPGYEDPTDNAIARIEAKFAQKFVGEFNYGKPIITPPGAKLTPLSFTPAEMAYFQSGEQVRDMIMAAFRVQKASIGLTDSMTYGSILATLGALCSDCLNPRLVMRGEGLTKHLASRWDEEYPAWSTREHGSSGGSRLVKLWWDDCLDPETECLTDRGWKKYDILTMETKIACYDDKTNTLVYRKPTRIINRHHDGEMCVWKGGRINSVMTPRHRVWVWNENKCGREESGWGFMEAQNLNPYGITFKIKRAAPAACEKPAPIAIDRIAGVYRKGRHPSQRLEHLGMNAIDPDVWLEFLGYYLSEGCIEEDKNRITLSQNDDNPCFDKMRRCVDLLGIGNWSYPKSEKSKERQFRRVDRGLMLHLLKHCGEGSRNKRIPDYVKAWPADSLWVLLEALLAGDGRISGTNVNTGVWCADYGTVSKQLADDVMELGIKCGLSASLSGPSPPQKPHQSPSYCVNLSTRIEVLVGPQHRSIINYSGPVWCVEVPTGKFVVRRGGRAHITGNCVPVDPQQVNSDIAQDMACYAISPNELRALRGRKAWKIGGNNPMVQSPGGVAPLIINEEEEADELIAMIAKLTEATQPADAQGPPGAEGGMPGMPGEEGGEEDIFKPELPQEEGEGEEAVPDEETPEEEASEEESPMEETEPTESIEPDSGDAEGPQEPEEPEGGAPKKRTARIENPNGRPSKALYTKSLKTLLDNVHTMSYGQIEQEIMTLASLSLSDLKDQARQAGRTIPSNISSKRGVLQFFEQRAKDTKEDYERNKKHLITKDKGTCKPGQNPGRDHCTPATDIGGGETEQTGSSTDGTGQATSNAVGAKQPTTPATNFAPHEHIKALDDMGKEIQGDEEAAGKAKSVFASVSAKLKGLAVNKMTTMAAQVCDSFIFEATINIQQGTGTTMLMKAAAYGAAKAWLGVRKLMSKSDDIDFDHLKKVMEMLAEEGGFEMPSDEEIRQMVADQAKAKSKELAEFAYYIEKKVGPFKYSNTQLEMPDLANDIIDFAKELIPEDDLAPDGYETEPHITCKFGLNAKDAREVKALVKGFGPISVVLSSVGVFYAKEGDDQRGSDNHDVVYIAVESADLMRLNKLLNQLPHTDTHTEYKPHITLGYAKPGTGQLFEGATLPESLQGEILFDELIFTTPDGGKTNIPLGMEAKSLFTSREKLVSALNGVHKNGKKEETEEEIYKSYRAKMKKSLEGGKYGS